MSSVQKSHIPSAFKLSAESVWVTAARMALPFNLIQSILVSVMLGILAVSVKLWGFFSFLLFPVFSSNTNRWYKVDSCYTKAIYTEQHIITADENMPSDSIWP